MKEGGRRIGGTREEKGGRKERFIMIYGGTRKGLKEKKGRDEKGEENR